MKVYGRNVLKEILENNVNVKMIYFSNVSSKSIEKLIELVKEKRLPFTIANNRILEKLSNEKKHQGVVIDIGDFEYKDESIIEKMEKPFLVILDQIQDPHNFGAIIRTSVAAGADALVIPKNNSVKVTPTVVKVSVGTLFKTNIIEVTNIARFIEKIKTLGIWVYGAAMDGKEYFKVDLKKPVAIVLGNEGNGIRENVKNKCDDLISIPMKNNVESLNVSVSAGILLYEVYRQNENFNS
ncbi:RNA methyltransferase [Thermosipho melanesiensis]|uniref:RNA methyltransferase, TrmH family, group 3 n=2 Tax=Thermosipho melanesiensis TaxID=46541 RepID=A6LN61_THEM4|nr:23S rRNA (guanosine(2251)-2'-O)-methyltransferase RlmB [Thermosipho melanesiensis]ABR31362.1 RNA methyltransferase, TrmH family, group 3 [Thermosipho melanesiensis BI429]APT74422.1 RNA methyltransferase [Thermosipho melanesiensis]OOC36385.1 RNA methyltransferase [Thermosipho melanesiensis]OOC37203.1 RNA methyltransferase [Thermosipho melanesiensis]OOC37955.1 RNA methyltransferase [Thermosipho melanesiensis]